jgi:predicted nucleic acid-binding protein
MIKRVFVDTDIILDVGLGRKPFFESSKMVLAVLENNMAIGFTSSNCIANIYYILKKAGGDENARIFLSRLLKYITVISIDHSVVMEALKSEFTDFEDALQHYSAIRNQCECIITRNISDYKYSKISIYLPIEYLRLYQEKI